MHMRCWPTEYMDSIQCTRDIWSLFKAAQMYRLVRDFAVRTFVKTPFNDTSWYITGELTLGHMPTVNTQIRLRVCAVWSRFSLYPYWIITYFIMYPQRGNALAKLCACAELIWIYVFRIHAWRHIFGFRNLFHIDADCLLILSLLVPNISWHDISSANSLIWFVTKIALSISHVLKQC